MCTDDMGTAHLHQPDPQVLHDFEPRVVFGLEPVDAVTVTTLMDNVTDVLMPTRDRPTARRDSPAAASRRPRWKAARPPKRWWPSMASRSW